MNIRRTTFILLGFLFVSSHGQSVEGMYTGIKLGRTTGHTLYNFSYFEFSDELNTRLGVKSELEFPLDMYLMGFEIRFIRPFLQNKTWEFGVLFWKDMTEPKEKMQDTDWILVPALAYQEKLSFTESEVRNNTLGFQLDGRIEIKKWPNGSGLDGMLGYRYLNYDYAMYGVKGWQLDADGYRQEFDEYQNQKVLTYKISYHVPFIGLAMKTDLTERSDIDIGLLYTPYAFARDTDDHLLRFKTLKGKNDGTFYEFYAEFTYQLSMKGGSVAPLLTLGYAKTDLSLKGKQKQEWYGDDPVSEGIDDTGTVISGLNSEIESEQQLLYLTLSYRF